MRNWQDAEKEFENYFRSRGKRSHVHRFEDTKAVRGRTKGNGFAAAQPSDYLVTDEGSSFYAEVKFCNNKISFPFGSIRPSQWTAARRVTAAGGSYYFYIYSTEVGTWFRVPASTLINSDKRSMKWSELAQHKWIH